MINATISKFGYPATLVAPYAHWVVLLRPAAVTLGSLVLASRHDATAYSDLPVDAWAEQRQVVGDIETTLRTFVAFEKINYLMLMMVDPHVHFHVVPRYEGGRAFGGRAFPDAGWPGMADLGGARALDADEIKGIVSALGSAWPASGG